MHLLTLMTSPTYEPGSCSSCSSSLSRRTVGLQGVRTVLQSLDQAIVLEENHLCHSSRSFVPPDV